MSPHSAFLTGFARSQLTTKSLFRSVHARVVLTATRISGFKSRSVLVAEKASMYFPRFTFSAVLPFPNRSYAAPTRGVMSLQLTPAVDRDGKSTTFLVSQPGPPTNESGYVVRMWSYRTP